MAYRLLVVVVALALIAMLLLGFWITARLFLGRYAPGGNRQEHSLRLSAWTFAGFGVGLVFVGLGGPVLGTLAFARTARELADVDWATAMLWGAVSNLLNALIAGAVLVALVLNQ